MLTADTIAAIATPPGTGAVALVRVSGPDVPALWPRLFPAASAPQPRVARLVTLRDAGGNVVDQVLATFFRGPASFTGEDTMELACHGGPLVTRRVLDAVLAAGARTAEPGEFSQRAFLNGKLDLTQAEAIMDLISAQTDLALRAANEQLEGRLGESMQALRAELLEILAHVEAYIDFPEEDIDPDTGAAMRARVVQAQSGVQRLLATADQGRILREGVRTVLAGAPNAGKSSLLNRLLGFDRAIVSEVPGTTRDTIEEVINLRGLPLRLVDTAGLRATEDSVEAEGVARTQQQMARADLVLHVVDASLPSGEAPDISAPLVLRVLNKADLGVHPSWQDGVAVSAAKGTGMDALADQIFDAITRRAGGFTADLVAINARHKACLERAAAGLDAALGEIDAGAAPELVSLGLREAMDAIGEVTGRADTEELLGVIFSKFCIGK